MNDVALPQGFEEQRAGGLGKLGQALLSANEGGRDHV
jgi:hypothetical protein